MSLRFENNPQYLEIFINEDYTQDLSSIIKKIYYLSGGVSIMYLVYLLFAIREKTGKNTSLLFYLFFITFNLYLGYKLISKKKFMIKKSKINDELEIVIPQLKFLSSKKYFFQGPVEKIHARKPELLFNDPELGRKYFLTLYSENHELDLFGKSIIQITNIRTYRSAIYFISKEDAMELARQLNAKIIFK